MSGGEAVVRAMLAGEVRRLRILYVLRGAAGGALLAAVASGIVRWRGGSVLFSAAAGGALLLVVAVAYIWSTANRRTPAVAARNIERHHAEFRNLLITSEELLRHASRAPDWIRRRVMDDAAAIERTASPPSRARLGLTAAAVVAALSVWGATLTGVHRPALEAVRQAAASAAATASGAPLVRITVTPPAYTATPETIFTNPDRLEVFEGSRLHVVLAGGDGAWRMRLGTSGLLTRRDGSSWIAEAAVTESGYLAVEPEGESRADRRLIAIAMTPDRAPAVTIDVPGRDLLLPEVPPRIAVRATAADDLGLRSLELRYTKVSGAGEQFEFVEGSIPVRIARESTTTWRGNADLPLAALDLETGDSLVYRVVARDGRPGDDGLGSSDTFLVETAGPGQAAIAGADLPPDQDRYALSQQMIVLKIERLRAGETAMPAEARREAFENLAAEQRAVRANFIFLMGGHVEDEEEEAERSHEIQEGRLEHRARRDIAAAVRHMTFAERGLAALDTSAALPPARAAVEALQRAFGHSRYILRATPLRSRIDRSRRLTGELASATDWLRAAEPRRDDSHPARARAMLARLLAIRTGRGGPAAAAIDSLAEEALAVDPASADWQRISRALARRQFDEARALLAGEAARDALAQTKSMARPSRLQSAWTEVRR